MPELLRLHSDRHIHHAITDQLAKHGVDVVRCEAVGLGDAADIDHLEYATREGRAVVTSDRDFLKLDAMWQRQGRKHGGIFYVGPEIRHQGAKGIGIVVRALLFYHQAIENGAATIDGDIANQVRYIRVREWK